MMFFLGDTKIAGTLYLIIFASLHILETLDVLTPHASAVGSWHFEKFSLIRSSTGLHIQRSYSVNTIFESDIDDTVTAATSTTTASTRLAGRHVFFYESHQIRTAFKTTKPSNLVTRLGKVIDIIYVFLQVRQTYRCLYF
jgi:hypothetical protein